MITTIVGVDCATTPSKVGVAIAEHDGNRTTVVDLIACSEACLPADTINRVLAGRRTRTLLAIDAPLGWPLALGAALVEHRAGRPLNVERNELFRRETDRAVYRALQLTPLDVGADRIARTAHAALGLLANLTAPGDGIPLAWTPGFEGTAAIEVYPAATLRGRNWRSSGYKETRHQQERAEMLHSLKGALTFACDVTIAQNIPDVLDAVVCVLAGADFLAGRAAGPTDLERARHEGWIWARTEFADARPA